MKNQNLSNFIIIFTVSIIITFFLAYLFPDTPYGSLWKSTSFVSSFIMVTILVSIAYNAIMQRGVIIFSNQLLIWLGIFLIIICGYAFRFELKDNTQRMLSAIAPSYNWSSKKGEVVIGRSNDGHFYLNVLVNGVNIKFMIDTGASDVALTVNDARRLGIDVDNLNYNKIYSTANGISRAAAIKLDNIIIGDTNFRDIEGHVSKGGLDISLLGMSLLERFKSFKIDGDILIINF